jgi:hypothetical protein
MIRSTATPAHIRKKRIEEAVADMNFNDDPIVQALNISIDSRMAKVEGSVMDKISVI